MTTTWRHRAACSGRELFVQGVEQHQVKRICRHCPVQRECLAEALDERIEFGVWGGMTERERRSVLRRHPDVSSWTAALGLRQPESAAGSVGPPSLAPTSRNPSRS